MESLKGVYKLIDDLQPGDSFVVTYKDKETDTKKTNTFIVADLGPVITPLIQEGDPNRIFVIDVVTGQLTAFDTGFEVFVLEQED